MKNFIKYSIVLLIAIILYVLMSYFLYGSFVNLTYVRSPSKIESQGRNTLLTKKLVLLFTGDSVEKHQQGFEIWQDKFIVITQYGLLPIRFTKEYSESSVISIKPLNKFEGWCVKFNEEEDLFNISHIQWRSAKMNNDSVNINFYKCSNIEPVFLGNLKIKWN